MFESMRNDEYKGVQLLKTCMSKYIYGSKEYELARKSLAFLCERIREREKSIAVLKK